MTLVITFPSTESMEMHEAMDLWRPRCFPGARPGRGAAFRLDAARRLRYRRTLLAVPEASRRLAAVTHRVLLDVSSLMYRAFFAMGDTERAPDGRPIGAVHGYLDMVARLMQSRRPDEVVHAYDHEWRPVARTDLYAGYKANRPPDPEGLPEQFVLLREVLDLTGMLQAQSPGLGGRGRDRRALRGRRRGRPRREVVSGDRDLIQLVRDPVVKLLYTVRGVSASCSSSTRRASWRSTACPRARYAEFAILRGDPSDGLPGVQGVGEKTARALVQTYGSIEEMLEDAPSDEPQPGPMKGKPALRARLLRCRATTSTMMRQIVPVNVDAPLERWQGERDDEALGALAEELGLRGPVKRVLAAMDSAGAS